MKFTENSGLRPIRGRGRKNSMKLLVRQILVVEFRQNKVADTTKDFTKARIGGQIGLPAREWYSAY